MKISLVVPVYNEQETISIFYDAVQAFEFFKLHQLEIILINDGSIDRTEDILAELTQLDPNIQALNFTRNFGKEAALMAGLHAATGDVVILMDVDLQDPLEVIPLMVAEWEKGYDMVLAKRVDRSTDSFLKRFTALQFYRIHNLISTPKIEENVGDFRLIDRKYVQYICDLKEVNLFMKGVLSWVGGKKKVVEYVRQQRVAGTTKFNFWKLWNLALEGFTNFSTVPLRVWTYVGLFIASFAFMYGMWIIFQTLMWGNNVKGYPSLLVSILFLGGIQLIGIGVLGEYIGRIYTEVKARPRYIVKDNGKRVMMSKREIKSICYK